MQDSEWNPDARLPWPAEKYMNTPPRWTRIIFWASMAIFLAVLIKAGWHR